MYEMYGGLPLMYDSPPGEYSLSDLVDSNENVYSKQERDGS